MSGLPTGITDALDHARDTQNLEQLVKALIEHGYTELVQFDSAPLVLHIDTAAIILRAPLRHLEHPNALKAIGRYATDLKEKTGIELIVIPNDMDVAAILKNDRAIGEGV
jgi:hypothetical protein